MRTSLQYFTLTANRNRRLLISLLCWWCRINTWKRSNSDVNYTQETGSARLEFGTLGRRVIEGRFDGGSMTSDSGVLLLAKLDQKLKLTDAAARAIADPREPSSSTHSIRDMLRQRVYGLVQGWEDLNKHTQLRRDIAYQTAVGREYELASAPARSMGPNMRPRFSNCSSPGSGRCGRRYGSSSAPIPDSAGRRF